MSAMIVEVVEGDLLDQNVDVIVNAWKNAVHLAHEKGFKSVAFPLIGAGTGGFNQEQTKTLMLDELSKLDLPMAVKVVAFKGAKK